MAIAAIFLIMATEATASAQATIEPNPAVLDRPLTLTITASGDAVLEPELSALEKDFRLIDRSRSTRYTTVDGELTRILKWTLVLAARQPGEVTIPAIPVGATSTQPLSVTVRLRSAGAREAVLAFVETQVHEPRAHVRQQILMTVRLFVRREVLFNFLTDPAADDVIIQSLGDPNIYQATRNGSRYEVMERSYALFPLRAGEIRIAAPVFKGGLNRAAGPEMPFGSMLPLGNIQPYFAIGEERTISIDPIPAGMESSWLPASMVKLTEKIAPADGPYPTDALLTRTVELEVAGQLHTQLLHLEPAYPTGLKVHADAPVSKTEEGPRGVIGKRTYRWALVPMHDGNFVIPELRINWWDVNNRQLQAAVLPMRTLEVIPAAPRAPVSDSPAKTESTTAAATRTHEPWQLLALLALAGWVLTASIWFAISLHRRRMSAESGRQEQISLRAARRQLERAIQAGDARLVRTRLITWVRILYSAPHCSSLAQVIHASHSPNVRTELERLDASIYGKQIGWNVIALRTALRQIQREVRGCTGARDALPQLYPDQRQSKFQIQRELWIGPVPL